MKRSFLQLGIQEPRRASDGSELPSARLVSIAIHDEADVPSNMFTHLLMLMGQFVDHDLTRTAASTLSTGKNVALLTQITLIIFAASAFSAQDTLPLC